MSKEVSIVQNVYHCSCGIIQVLSALRVGVLDLHYGLDVDIGIMDMALMVELTNY